MKTIANIISVIAISLISIYAQADNRKVCIDKNWQFQYGYHSELTEIDNWEGIQTINLPHDWSVEASTAEYSGRHTGPFINDGGDYQKGHMLGGEGWYHKRFTLDSSSENKIITLYFEGVYNYATVWVNGVKVYFNHYGYSPFRVDITDQCNPVGEVNDIVVKVQNEGWNTRWYSGSGIYRHVWLITTDKLHLDEWSAKVYTESAKESNSSVSISAEISNESLADKSAKLNINIVDAQGQSIASKEVNLTVEKASTCKAKVKMNLANVQLWNLDSPYLYKAIISLEGYDEIQIPFGIRTIEVSAKGGFKLNGKSVLLKGGCVHHDNGLLGACGIDRADIRRVKLMKENGFNAVRCAHNLPSEAFLHACDSIGLLVIDETFDQWYEQKNSNDYHIYFPEYYDREVQLMVRRDRNHPSVAIWSIGNEIPGRTNDNSVEAASQMREMIFAEDSTRFITAALCGWDSKGVDWGNDLNKASVSLDVVGNNYLYGYYAGDHNAHPDMVMCGTESYPKEASQNWDQVERNSYVIGDFVWTAMDYLGEAGIGHGLFVKDGLSSPFFMPYPYYNGWCGDIDLIGEKKPQSYYRDVVWREQPITMAVELPCPSGYHREISGWGWQPEVNAWEDPSVFYADNNLANIMYNGEKVAISKPASLNNNLAVNVYSRSKQVRLYLNDRLIGTQSTSNTYWAGFSVPYEPGVLRAVEWDGTKEGASFELKTCGEPVAIRLKVDRSVISPDGADLAFVTAELIDADGQVVHDYSHKVTFSGVGDAEILVAGNANPTEMGSFRVMNPSFYDGRAMAIVQAGDVEGEFVLTARCKGFSDVSTTIKIASPSEDTSVQTLTMARPQISVANNRIYVIGDSNFRIYNMNGTEMNPSASLSPGVYLASTSAGNYKVLVR